MALPRLAGFIAVGGILSSCDTTSADFKGSDIPDIPYGQGGYGVDIGKYLEARRKGAGSWLVVADGFNCDLAASAPLASACPFSDVPT